jgi:hypothetical protein
VVFGSVAPSPWPIDDVDPVGLDRPLFPRHRLPGGTRVWCSVIPAGLGFRLRFRFSALLRADPFAVGRFSRRVHRAGSIEPPTRLKSLLGRSIRVPASLEVCFPSAFAGRVAPSEAASLRTIPLRRLVRPSRGPPEVGAIARRNCSSLRFYRLVWFVRPAHAARWCCSRFTPARCG